MTDHATLVSKALDQVNRHAGLVFKDVRLAGAIEMVDAWLVEHHIIAPDQIGPGGALDELLEDLVVHESYFDRDREQLALVDELVLAALLHTAEPFRVWSAGCASGEEPYTLAFMLAARGLLARATILATDLSRSALDRAREGRYRPWAVRTGAETPARRYLVHDGNDWCVPAPFKRAVRFEQLNLVEDAFPRDQHLIVCRNVLIYLDASAIAAVAQKLADALAPQGWLFVAPSDPRLDPHAPLTATITDRGVYYRLTTAHATTIPSVGSRARTASHRPAPATASIVAPRRARRVPSSVAARATSPVALGPHSASERIRGLADRGDDAGARAALATAIAAAPLDAELYFLDAVLLAPHDVAASLRALDRAIYLQPDAPISYLFAGRLQQSAGDREGARRSYRRALAILEHSAPAERVLWSDEPAWIMTDACRGALAALS